MTTINGVPRELIERAIKDEQSWPRLDGNWACVGCGNWMPKGHPEAHEHEEGCQEEDLAKQRHWRSQLRALLAEQPQAGAGQAVLAALDWVDDFVARCNGDDRGSCESVNTLRKALTATQPAARQEHGDEVRRLREALAGLVALYEDDEGCRSLPQYKAARAALTHSQQGEEDHAN